MEFVAAPQERWAKLAERMHDTEHAGDGTTEEPLRRSVVARGCGVIVLIRAKMDTEKFGRRWIPRSSE